MRVIRSPVVCVRGRSITCSTQKKRNSTHERKHRIIPRLSASGRSFTYRPSMRTCGRRAMCRILSLVATLTRRTHKNDVDGTPLRIERRLTRATANTWLSNSRASSPRFVLVAPFVSSLRSDSSRSAWPRTSDR